MSSDILVIQDSHLNFETKKEYNEIIQKYNDKLTQNKKRRDE